MIVHQGRFQDFLLSFRYCHYKNSSIIFGAVVKSFAFCTYRADSMSFKPQYKRFYL